MALKRPERVLFEESRVMVCAVPLPTRIVSEPESVSLAPATAPSAPMSGVESMKPPVSEYFNPVGALDVSAGVTVKAPLVPSASDVSVSVDLPFAVTTAAVAPLRDELIALARPASVLFPDDAGT